MEKVSLTSIFLRFRWKMSFTFLLVFIEAGIFLLFPLVIGFAINGMIEKDFTGIYQLLGLGVALIVSGFARRLYDTRIYAHIYETLAFEITQKQKNKSVSAISAKTTMLKELVEFFENSFPEMVNHIIGFVGTLVILFTFSTNIFLACLATILFIGLIFGLSSKKTEILNRNYNNTLEEQVSILASKNPENIQKFFKKMMHWNIKLSDLESINFSLSWLIMIAMVISAVVDAIALGLTYGAIFSIITYVFNFAENSSMLPLYYQQYVRLKEISGRL